VHPGLIDLVKKYCKDFPDNLEKQGFYFYSQTPGNAKTSLAVCAMKNLIRNGKILRKATYLLFFDLVNFLRRRYIYNEQFDAMQDIEILIQRSDFLLLDDVGKQVIDQRLADYYFYVFNKLYESNAKVFMTSNFSISNLRNQFEIREEVLNSVLSRLMEMCFVVELTNRDFRLV
ncbi:MAG: ATP-binding protein, partial [Candidatus Heimdallarchaeaceae archaeon]